MNVYYLLFYQFFFCFFQSYLEFILYILIGSSGIVKFEILFLVSIDYFRIYYTMNTILMNDDDSYICGSFG